MLKYNEIYRSLYSSSYFSTRGPGAPPTISNGPRIQETCRREDSGARFRSNPKKRLPRRDLYRSPGSSLAQKEISGKLILATVTVYYLGEIYC